jgi:hypothetical protein
VGRRARHRAIIAIPGLMLVTRTRDEDASSAVLTPAGTELLDAGQLSDVGPRCRGWSDYRCLAFRERSSLDHVDSDTTPSHDLSYR